MTLMERLKQLLGSDSDVEVDDDVDIEEVIKNKVKTDAVADDGSGDPAGAGDPKKSEAEAAEGLTEDPNKQVSGVPEAGDVKEKETSEVEVDTSKSEEVKNEDQQVEGDPKPDDRGGEGADQQVVNEESVDQKSTIFEDGWFDETTGKVDISKIKDDSVKNAFDMVLKWFSDNERVGLIDRAVDEELRNNYLLNVKPERLKSMLDLQQVTVEDGVVSGVKDAIEALKADEPGLFRDKSKESNPLNEGFNPVERKNANPRSFLEAQGLSYEIG